MRGQNSQTPAGVHNFEAALPGSAENSPQGLREFAQLGKHQLLIHAFAHAEFNRVATNGNRRRTAKAVIAHDAADIVL